MHLPVDHLRVELTTKACDIPPDERARLQTSLAVLAGLVEDFPDPTLWIDVIYHPQSNVYHVASKLKWPGRTIFTGEQDPYLDTALQRCLRKVIRKTETYKEHPDREAVAAAERRDFLDREIVAPEAPDAGPLGQAAEAGDYRTFRTALAGYEEWLRKRVGRLVQRIPEAQARLGKELLLGDIVEEVYLNAFEQFTRRPTVVRLSEWIEGLIDPSIRALLRHPGEEAEAASMARTLRETPVA
jgi:hypothetical protein